jgi:uroporphyrinogen-III decarboxylase
VCETDSRKTTSSHASILVALRDFFKKRQPGTAASRPLPVRVLSCTGGLSRRSLREICLTLIRHRIVPILRCDGNWDKNLDCFRDLQAGRFCLQFDGRTNIFRAAEMLEGHCTLFGDVPASLLVLGTTGEVDRTCRRLITRVGRNGSYILGAGCEIPPDARPENVWTLIRSAEKYGYCSH